MLFTILTLKEGMKFGRHVIVSRMRNRIFRDRPALPHYASIYNAYLVIELLKSLPTWNEIDLKWLTLKNLK